VFYFAPCEALAIVVPQPIALAILPTTAGAIPVQSKSIPRL